MTPLTNAEHEEFSQQISQAIASDDQQRYRELMDGPGNPLLQLDITRADVIAIQTRVHYLARKQ